MGRRTFTMSRPTGGSVSSGGCVIRGRGAHHTAACFFPRRYILGRTRDPVLHLARLDFRGNRFPDQHPHLLICHAVDQQRLLHNLRCDLWGSAVETPCHKEGLK